MARRFSFRVVAAGAVVALLAFAATEGRAQSTGGQSRSSSEPEGAGRSTGGTPAAFSSAAGTGLPSGLAITGVLRLTDPATRDVVVLLNSAVAFCRGLPRKEYTIDCLAYQYRQVAQQLPRGGEYAAARAAIERAATQLEGVVREFAATDLPPAHVTRPGVGRTARPLSAVDPGRSRAAATRAAAILAEAQTVLLRSSENSARRQLHYQRISAAVGSGTVLLRSL